MEFFNDHKKLFRAATLFFVGLTILVAILPAIRVQQNNAPLPNAVALSTNAVKGKAVYIANGCVACHTQQVRNVDMDKAWGTRPNIAADYAGILRTDIWRNTATLMGTERTGPDLTNVGLRQPSLEWNLVHLYNPRILVKESVMPAYPWLFKIRKTPDKNDVVVNIPEEFMKGKTGKVVATKEALYLIEYLQTLKQVPLPDGSPSPEFLYKREQRKQAEAAGLAVPEELDGATLYTANCQACHQANGEGLKGAFPPLKGSKFVTDDDPTLLINIIMKGYNGRADEGFGAMPPVGVNNGLSAEEITAIINHERSSWGNNARKVDADEVKKILDIIKNESE